MFGALVLGLAGLLAPDPQVPLETVQGNDEVQKVGVSSAATVSPHPAFRVSVFEVPDPGLDRGLVHVVEKDVDPAFSRRSACDH